MKVRTRICIMVVCLLAALSIPVCAGAQGNSAQNSTPKHHHYTIIDLGTFGGPNSFISTFPLTRVLNDRGEVAGGAETDAPDPFPQNCFAPPECLVSDSFVWKSGSLTDLRGLVPGFNSVAAAINQQGTVLGVSQNGAVDPLTGIPEFRAVVWKNGGITDVGTLGGNQTFAENLNDHGDAVGGALIQEHDDFADFFSSAFLFGTPTVTKSRAFLWQDGKIQSLGTLGGPDSVAFFINNHRQIAGVSFTSSTVDSNTGGPPVEPFLWENGKMKGLGTFGGAFGDVRDMNERGQITGFSDLPGDVLEHAYLWDQGKLRDLGTLPGATFSFGLALNNRAEVVGFSNLPRDGKGPQGHTFLWKDGAISDLGSLPGFRCSFPVSINSQGTIVGSAAAKCGMSQPEPVIWEGRQIFDLNTLISPASELNLLDAEFINDRGEIAGDALLPNGDVHVVLLRPSQEEFEDSHDAEMQARSARAQANSSTVVEEVSPKEMMRDLLSRRSRDLHRLPR